MSEFANRNPAPAMLGDAIIQAIRQAVREEIQAAMGQNDHQDRLLDAEEASKILSVSPDWLYRRAARLPFTRKLGPRVLRFSYQGIQKFLTSNKFA